MTLLHHPQETNRISKFGSVEEKWVDEWLAPKSNSICTVASTNYQTGEVDIQGKEVFPWKSLSFSNPGHVFSIQIFIFIYTELV